MSEDEEQKFSIYRHDLARGLIRNHGGILEDSGYYGPLFCIPFEMIDKTSIDNLTQKAIWALSCVVSYVERGDTSGYMDNIRGFRCVKSRDSKDKWIIVKEETERVEMDDGEVSTNSSNFSDELHKLLSKRSSIEAASKNVFREMEMFIRIHEARGAILEDDESLVLDSERCEHFLVLIVRCPLAFSLRSAVYESLQSRSRGVQDTYVDSRRTVWNLLANHMREGLYGFRDEDGRPCYSEKAISNSLETTNIDWMKITNEDSFSCLFSVHRSVDWIRRKFFQKYSEFDHFELEGFGILSRSKDQLSPAIVSEYVQFDMEVDKALSQKVNEKQTRKKTKKRKQNASSSEGSENAMVLKSKDSDDEENVPEKLTIGVPMGYSMQTTDGKYVYGYPPCTLSMNVVIPAQVESIQSFHQFEGHIKSFPASLILGILRKTLVLEEGTELSDSSNNPSQFSISLKNLHGKEEAMTLTEINSLICGKDYGMGRAMLSGGDASLAKHCQESIASLVGERESMRFQMLKSFIRLSFGLSLTRSMGSDGYTNERVASYGRFLENMKGSDSRQDCKSTFERWSEFSSDCPDLTHEAMLFIGHVIHTCNVCKWDLRPDNVFYILQLMISDIMLCLNFHGSVIGGACNGIGATIVVRDGGGNFRRWFRDPSSADAGTTLGQIFSKRYGSGADMVIGMYKIVVDIGLYDERFRLKESFVSELKRTTEMGLMQDCCNVTECVGNDKRHVHTVVDTMARTYSTELKAGNDAQSQSCMQAIAWLIPRNTTAMDINVFKTTREHEKTKARVYVEYRQVTYGYWLICSNHVGLQSRERFRTILTVSRSISSSASALPKAGNLNDLVMGWNGQEERNSIEFLKRINGLPDLSAGSNNSYDSFLGREARPLFFSALCTSVLTGFMQWTGGLGKLSSSYVTEALLGVFYVQLELNKDILNPDMFNAGEKARCYQISKARGVAFSLLSTCMRETIEAGRKERTHQDAVERASLSLMTESISPSSAPWIMADTLEHMLRLDFFILIQLFCQKLEVPEVGISLEDVLIWLKTGLLTHCDVLKRWFDVYKKKIIRVAGFDHRAKGNGMTNIEYCMYITHESGLTCSIPEGVSDMDAVIVNTVGAQLFRQYSSVLSNYCQIVEAHGGEEIVRGMLSMCCNKQFNWPSVFGSEDELRCFWQGRRPKDDQKEFADFLSLAPFRTMIMDVRKGAICVDMRWLLLGKCLVGCLPSQSSRYAFVSRWVQYFYAKCIPKYMLCSKEVFCGMPSPYMHGGFISPLVLYEKRGRCMLRRPSIQMCLNDFLAIIGVDAPVASKVVEDMGPAAERYELSKLLNVCERDLATKCVSSYRLPYDVWIPVLVGSTMSVPIFGSLQVIYEENKYVYKLCLKGDIFDITSGDEQHEMRVESANEAYKLVTRLNDDGVHDFLNGRVFVEIRPLCFFLRPGVLLKVMPPNDFDQSEICAVILSYDFQMGLYKILCSCGTEIEKNPYEVEDCVQPFKNKVLVRLKGLCLSDVDSDSICFYSADSEMEWRDIDENYDYLQAELCIPREDLQNDFEQNDFIGNGYVSVILRMLNGSLRKNEIEELCSGGEMQSSCIVANIHVTNLSFSPSNIKNLFLSIGYKKTDPSVGA